MYKMLSLMVLASFALAGCATSGSNLSLGPGDSPADCASQEALHPVPQSEQYKYMQRCTAGYDAAKKADDNGTFKLKSPHKGKQGQ